ncbi:MAG: HDOD domain-containing protein, partial [Pseudomonadales bacterium]|nr:HDOD domain-containing protein [Pseudomonadales bacterium]
LPVVVPRLLRGLRDPSSSSADFVEIIQHDPVLASSVIKLVNSVYYNPTGKTIDSFHRAVVILGLDGLRFVISGTVMQPIIESKSGEFPDFGRYMWTHALHTAVTTQLLARRFGGDPFKAYLAGLVHDMGAVTLFNQYLHRHRDQAAGVPQAGTLAELIETQGETLGVRIVRDWNLPAEIASAIESQSAIRRGEPVEPLAGLLYLANHVSEAYLIRNESALPDEPTPPELEACVPGIDVFRELDAMSALFEI